MESTELLRLLVPDVASFWKYLYNGTRAAGVDVLVRLLAYLIGAVAFGLLVSELALLADWRSASGKLVRFFVMAIAVGSAGGLVGKDANSAPLWRLYHDLYSAVYGPGGFYSAWLMGNPTTGGGPIYVAITRIDQALHTLAVKRAEWEFLNWATGDAIIGALPFLKGACSGQGSSPAGLVGIGVSALCRTLDLANQATKSFAAVYEQATSRLFVALLVLLGAHAAIIYLSVVMTYAATFFLPLAAALFLFRSTEKALPSLAGLVLGVYLALILSAVAFGASAAVLFNTVAARIEKALPEDKELKAQVEELRKEVKSLNDNYPQVEAGIKSMEAKLEAWRAFRNAAIQGELVSPTNPNERWVEVGFAGTMPDVDQYVEYSLTVGTAGKTVMATPKSCTFSGTNPAAMPSGTRYVVSLGDIDKCIHDISKARFEATRVASQLTDAPTGLIAAVQARLTASLRNILFTMTLLTGGATVLATVLAVAMISVVTFSLRTVGGGAERFGAPVGGRPGV